MQQTKFTGAKRIDFDDPIIPAGGKKYSITKDLTIARFKQLEALEMEFYYGVDMRGMFETLKAVYADLNKTKPMDAGLKVYRLMEGVADRIDKREPVVLRICSLFLVTEDEDVTTWSEELAKKKIEDWAKEGYAIDDFFSLAATLVPGFLKDYQSILEDSFLQEIKEEKEPKPQSKSTKKK